MKNTTTISSFKKCVLAAVVALVTTIGLVSMPILASASTIEVFIEEADTDTSVEVVDPLDGSTVGNDPIIITVNGENIDTIRVYLDNNSGTPIAIIPIGQAGEFTENIEITLPSSLSNGNHTIIVEGNSLVGTPEVKTDNVAINYNGGQPQIDEILPFNGPSEGGTEITIKGDNFTPDSTVVIGDEDCLNVIFVDQYTLKCATPPHSAGDVNIVVTTPNGTVTKENGFRYVFMDVLVPNTGLFQIGSKTVSLYEVIGIIALLIVLIAAFTFLLIGGKRNQSKKPKSVYRQKTAARRKVISTKKKR